MPDYFLPQDDTRNPGRAQALAAMKQKYLYDMTYGVPTSNLMDPVLDGDLAQCTACRCTHERIIILEKAPRIRRGQPRLGSQGADGRRPLSGGDQAGAGQRLEADAGRARRRPL